MSSTIVLCGIFAVLIVGILVIVEELREIKALLSGESGK